MKSVNPENPVHDKGSMTEWKEYKLSELYELNGGGTPKTSIPEYWNGNIPWLSVTDFNTRRKYCFDAEKVS